MQTVTTGRTRREVVGVALASLGAPAIGAATPREARPIDIAEPGLIGRFYPANSAGRGPAVIMLNGSDGGLPAAAFASDLARSGVSALALAFLPDVNGMPRGLSPTAPVPLETVFNGLEWLKRRSQVDPARLALMGVSRGAELALLVGSLRNDVTGVVAFSPGRHVWGAPTARLGVKFDRAMWSLGGTPLPYRTNKPDFALPVREWFARAPDAPGTEIAVERIGGPMLLISSTADGEWPASDYADDIVKRLRSARFTHPVVNAQFPDASHLLMGFGPEITKLPVPGTSYVIDFGGSADGTRRARDAAWAMAKDFLLRIPPRSGSL